MRHLFGDELKFLTHYIDSRWVCEWTKFDPRMCSIDFVSVFGDSTSRNYYTNEINLSNLWLIKVQDEKESLNEWHY